MKKGIHKNLSNDAYHDDRTHASSSVLKTVNENPIEYRRVYVDGGKKEPIKNQAALDLGNYMHIWLLEPEKFEDECIIYPSKQRRGKPWEFFKSENEGKYIITQPQAEVAEAMKEEFDKSTVMLDEGLVDAKTLFTEGEAELSLFIDLEFPLNAENQALTGEETGKAAIKVRADYLIDRGDHFILRDLKTTGKCPNDIKTAKGICYDFYYFLSAALYLDAFAQYYKKRGVFDLVFSSKMDSKLNYYRVGEKSLSYGRSQYVSALNSIYYWKLTGNYPLGMVREL